jgi:ribonuclease P protein component
MDMAVTKQLTFGKDEKLCSTKVIESLFDSGKSFSVFPFRIVWDFHKLKAPVQVVFIVSKKNFRMAVDRNRIRRQIREIYRHHKHELFEWCVRENKQVALMVVYNGKKRPEFREIESKIIVILRRLVETLRGDDQ